MAKTIEFLVENIKNMALDLQYPQDTIEKVTEHVAKARIQTMSEDQVRGFYSSLTAKQIRERCGSSYDLSSESEPSIDLQRAVLMEYVSAEIQADPNTDLDFLVHAMKKETAEADFKDMIIQKRLNGYDIPALERFGSQMPRGYQQRVMETYPFLFKDQNSHECVRTALRLYIRDEIQKRRMLAPSAHDTSRI
ncbi:hypothetical protein GF351_01725 [Candidatus Woesearchaeota archaeon]|nr:hypothetical protein [Candidatus Woesearchaeota archaeon]